MRRPAEEILCRVRHGVTRAALVALAVSPVLFVPPASSQVVIPIPPVSDIIGGIFGLPKKSNSPSPPSNSPVFKGPYSSTATGQPSLNGTTCAGLNFRGSISSHTCPYPPNYQAGLAHNNMVLADRPMKLGIFTRLCAAPQSALTPNVRATLAALADQYNAAVEEGLQGIANCNIKEANDSEIEQMKVLQQVDGVIFGAIQYGDNVTVSHGSVKRNSIIPSIVAANSDESEKSAPTDKPPGTRPIDSWGIGKDDIHDIKDGVGAGPKDWVGITPDGDVITTGDDGKAVDHGNVNVYLNKPIHKFQP